MLSSNWLTDTPTLGRNCHAATEMKIAPAMQPATVPAATRPRAGSNTWNVTTMKMTRTRASIVWRKEDK